MAKLVLNILPFMPKEAAAVFYFSVTPVRGVVTLHLSSLSEGVKSKLNTDRCVDGKLYTRFDVEFENASPVLVNFADDFSLYRTYLNIRIKDYFRGVDGVVVGSSFVDDVEIWIPAADEDTDTSKAYRRFNLKIFTNDRRGAPLLNVSYRGISCIFKHSVSELLDRGADSELFTQVVYNGRLFRYSNMPDVVADNLDRVYPKLGGSLCASLGVRFARRPIVNRYKHYHTILNCFKKEYLDTDGFLAIIPHSGQWFDATENGLVSKIDNVGGAYRFGGGGVHTDFHRGMATYGPYVRVPNNHVKLFIIYSEADRDRVMKLHNELKGDSANSLKKYARILASYSKEHNIIITDDTNPLPDVEKALSAMVLSPNTSYFAIYISPISKVTANPVAKNVYFQIKQQLLQRGIVSQVLEREKMDSSAFCYFIPNIQVAMLAKLGAIPWTLAVPDSQELVVGVGAFKQQGRMVRYIGSTCSFAGDGHFRGYKAFPETSIRLLAGSIQRAIVEFCEKHGKPKRLVIHFYKDMSNRELQPIEEVLDKMELKIPVVILKINRTESSDFIGFDESVESLMPVCGTVVSLRNSSYLLFNTPRFDGGNMAVKGNPFPLRITLKANQPGLIDSPDRVNMLLQQVYNFSGMYWKSISRQNMPVTILYPSLLADFYMHFNSSLLPEAVGDKPWFL